MATEKALFTNQADFKTKGIAFSADPFLFYSPESDTTDDFTEVRTVTKVPGVFRNASSFGTANAYADKSIATKTRHVVSLFVNFTPADLSATFKILFTHRGWGASPNVGIHLAMYLGEFNARIYGASLLDIYSTSAGQSGFRPVANKTYHIVFKYDENDVNKLELFVDGVRVLYSGVSANLGGINRRFTVGDMPGGGGTSAYPFGGWIDEFHYWVTNTPDITYLLNQYPIDIRSGNWIDWWTEPGSMMVGKNSTGAYTGQMQNWASPTIDLGADGFGDFGRVQVNFEQPTDTLINILTRTSIDGITWNDWIKVRSNGTVNSPDNRFMQVEVEFQSGNIANTPKIMEIQVLDYPKKKRLSLTSEPLIVYRDLDTGLERMGELVNAYDIYIVEEVNGEESLEFKMATNDPKRLELGSEPVEMIAEIGDKHFIIKNPIDKRDESGKKYTEFFAEATWYELRDAKVIAFESVEQTATDTLQAILNQSIIPTGWTVYKVDITIKRTIRGEWKSVLELFHEVRDIYGGELLFDTKNKTVSLVEKVGEDNGVRFYYNKNLKTIERSVDTFNLVTRLYLYGKEGMTVKSVNNNVEYLEDTTWVDALQLRKRIRIQRFSDGRYTIPQNLMDDGAKMITEMAKPNIGYAMTVNDLSMLSGHEHESIGLGDTVFAVDTELLNLLVESRIVKRKYNVRQPWKTEVELNQPKKELADANKRSLDDAVELLAETNPLNVSDVQQMTVFNHLLNSRAEDGTAYWEQTGTGITPVIGGFSGGASFEVVGGYGETNILKQSVFGVSHRSAYTVSAYVANDGVITRGPTQDAFVGIRVRMHYTEPDTDGETYEDHYLAIPDVTQGGS